MNSDNVNHPSHYNNGEIECIDGIKAALGTKGCLAFDIGNAMKYIWRFEGKGGVEDLRKAIWYLNHAVGLYEEEEKKEVSS